MQSEHIFTAWFDKCTQWHNHWGGGGGGRVPPLTANNLLKIKKNREKIRKKRGNRGKLGRKGKNREGPFTLPLLTDRAGYATECTSTKNVEVPCVIGEEYSKACA